MRHSRTKTSVCAVSRILLDFALSLCVASWPIVAAVAQSAEQASPQTNPAPATPPTPQDTQPQNARPPGGKPMDQVNITARREIERRTLDHVVIPKFVESHAAAGGKYDQVARWGIYICPTVVGLDEKYAALVAARITEIAASIGAPTAKDSNCNPNVEILFTSEPQAVLDYIAKNNEDMLGYHYKGQLKKLATFNHLVQTWYATASRNGEGIALLDTARDPSNGGLHHNITNQPRSRLKAAFSSEFVNVLVIVDADNVGDHSLKSITDYIALLTLTRTTSLDVCNELPSILDLLSSGCGQRAKPTSITDADIAYLKALYSSDMQSLLNLQKGEMHDRMLKQMSDH